MIKLVLTEYRQTMKEGFKNLFTTGRVFVIIYILVMIVPVYEPGLEKLMLYYCDIIPLALAVMFTGMYPNRLSKTLFLCPMSKEQRMNYLKTGFWLRAAVPIVVYFILNTIALLAGKSSLIGTIGMLLPLTSAILAQNLWIQTKGEDPKRGQKLAFSYKRYQSCYLFVTILGILSAVLFSILRANIDHANRNELIYIISLVLIQILLMLYEMKTYYRKVMSIMSDYEKTEALEIKEG
ncbi:MAG: hypothetical protein Q4F05_10310 [bacterium]|nr:hypothetical protein [bacterium]